MNEPPHILVVDDHREIRDAVGMPPLKFSNRIGQVL